MLGRCAECVTLTQIFLYISNLQGARNSSETSLRSVIFDYFVARGPAHRSQIRLYAYALRDCRLSRGENKSTEENLPEGINVASRGESFAREG